MISLEAAETWSARAIGLATLLQSIEMLQVHRALRDDGVFAWPVLRREHRALPALLRLGLALLLPYRAFMLLTVLRVGLSVLLLLTGNSLATLLLLITQIATAVRFRGAFNGGSDSMSVIVLLALSLARLAQAWPLAVAACLVYIAAQLTLSYFIAGVAKLREPRWRDGTALTTFCGDARFGAPTWVRRVLSVPAIARILASGVLLFECCFPLALAGSRAALFFTAVGAVFHLMNSVVFGLNRFFFAWLAAYPALLFASSLHAGVAP
ncbi:MAG: HTTM domain-containing protein [Myxococcota bacterium]